MRRRIVLLTLLVMVGSLVVGVPVGATYGDLEIGVDTTLTEDHNGDIEIVADNVTLDCAGHKITWTGDERWFGIGILESTGVTVRNCEVSGDYQFAMFSYFGSHNTMESNVIHGNSDAGIVLHESSDNLVTGNEVYENEVGIAFGGYRNVVSYNEVWGHTQLGIGFSAHDTEVIGNQVYENAGNGIRLDGGASGNTLTGNKAHANDECGFRVSGAPSGNTLSLNEASNNGEFGICDETSGGSGDAGTDNSYFDNVCLGNTSGSSNPFGLCASGDELISVDSASGEIVPLGQSILAGSTMPEIAQVGPSTFTRVGIDVVWGGYLGGPSGADILVYDRDTGWFEFRTVSVDGYTSPFWEASGTRGWSHVVPGDYDGDGIADLLFYRATDGLMRFYTITASGTFRAMTPAMWGTRGWTHMIPGDFDGNGTDDLMWYRAGDGLMRFYKIIDASRFTPMTPVMYGTRNWDRIPSGDFDADGSDDLMYYRATDGLYRFYTISATGKFTPISDVGYTTTGWEQILTGWFDTDPGADLVFYQAGTIQALGYSTTALIPITDAASLDANQVLTVLDWGPIN